MANELNFNGHPFSVLKELDEKEVFSSDEETYKNFRRRGEYKGLGRFTQPFIPIEELPSEIPSPEDILLWKEERGII